jgi:ABC-type sugar transport system substrate-binding protein
LIFVFAAVVVFGGTEKEKEKPILGFVMLTLTHPYHVEQMESGKKAAEAYGAESIWLSSEVNMEKNLTNIEALIEQGVDIIICDPVDVKGILPAIDKCKEAGIPFITSYGLLEHAWAYNTPCPDRDNMYGLTQIMAAYKNYNARVCKLVGLPGQYCAEERKRGFDEAVVDIRKKHPEFKVLSEQPTDWDPVKAQKILEDWLVAYDRIDGIVTSSDGLLYAGVELVKNAGREYEINLFGHDGDVAALELVRDGAFKADCLLGATRLQWFIVRYAMDILDGKNPQKVAYMPTYFVMTDETAKRCYANGLSKDYTYITPEKAIEYATKGYLEFGPDKKVTY